MITVAQDILQPVYSQLVAEVHTTLRQLQSLDRVLNLLMSLSAAQMQQENPDEWDSILARKQLLLDELEALHPGRIVQEARALMERLHAAHLPNVADELRDAVAHSRDRFTELAQCEHAAEQALRQQIERLHTHLLAGEQQQQMRLAYRRVVEGAAPRARFMNGTR